MAISKSFFGLRRKSTKSLTFSVLNGQQITKDRVSHVKNPKSEGQALQRMRFALLSVNLAAYRPILERSVESVAYGNPSVQYVMARNMKNWKLQGYRKDSGFQPAEMQLSFGSLPSLDWHYGEEESEHVVEVQNIRNLEAPITIGKIRAAIGAEVGDQLTLVGAFSTGDPTNPYTAGWDSFYFTEELENVVVSEDEPSLPVNWLNGGSLFALNYFIDGLSAISAEGNDNVMIAFTTILSRDGNGKHLRSNAFFKCADMLGSSLASAIVAGRNSFMGITDLVTDWPVEATPIEHVIYTLGAKSYTLGQGDNAVTGSVAVLVKQIINGNQISSEEIGITPSGYKNDEVYQASPSFPLQLLDAGWTWTAIETDGEQVPSQYVSYDVARARVAGVR